MDARLRRIQKEILGPDYDLSVAFLSPREMRKVTRRIQPRRVSRGPDRSVGKKRNTVSNVLAFPLSKNSGEILICKESTMPYTIPYLFIHGLLHLKGHRHGARMESAERQIMKRFGISIT